MRISRHFTDESNAAGASPYDGIEFRTLTSEIRNPDGSVVFRQDDIEVPSDWSQVACDVLAQKYFRKAGIPARLKPVKERGVPSWLWRRVPDVARLDELPEGERYGGEHSARQVFDRLAGTWTYWGWKGGLFAAEADAARARIPDAIVSEMIRAFSWDVDFQRDLHQGDRFSVMFEQLRGRDSAVLGTGDLIYARLVLGGQPRALYRHVTADGTAGYYTPDGRSARKELLRTPVDGARLSSQFGMRRHPILGYSRMHRGIDFAAPTGTPVFAAGDGRITFIGRNKGYGNYIRIDHTGATATTTAYGHLSRFAPGLRQNSVVKQGQVIAQVGSSGMSTGPHLHYEFMVDGQQIDPLQARSVTQISLNGDEMTRFAATMAMADRQFAALGHDNAITVTAAAAR